MLSSSRVFVCTGDLSGAAAERLQGLASEPPCIPLVECGSAHSSCWLDVGCPCTTGCMRSYMGCRTLSLKPPCHTCVPVPQIRPRADLCHPAPLVSRRRGQGLAAQLIPLFLFLAMVAPSCSTAAAVSACHWRASDGNLMEIIGANSMLLGHVDGP